MSVSPAASVAAAPPQVSQRRLTIGLCTNVVAIAFESMAVATAMPVAARDLDGLAYYAWAFSLFVIGMLFATVVAGRLADRIGPVKPLAVGLLIFSIGLVIAGTAEHMLQLVGGRLVQGLGSGLMNTAVFVCVAQAYAPIQRPRIFTMISTAWVLPAFVGPPIAAWLTVQLSWHWVFFAVIPLVIFGGLVALPTLRTMQRSYVRPQAEPDGARPAPLWAAGAVAVAAALIQFAGQRLGWLGLALFIVGVTLLVLGLPRLMPACFTRLERGLPAVIASRGFLAGAFIGAEAFVPLMLVESRGVPLVIAGVSLTVGAIGWTTGSWLQSRPWLRIRRDRLIVFGCSSLTVGLLGTTLVAVIATLPYWLVGVAWVFSGLGMGLATSSTSLATMTLSAHSEQGRNASSLNLSDALGGALFVGVSGTIFATLHGSAARSLTFGSVLAAMVLVAVLAVLVSLRIGAVRNEFAEADA